MKFFNGRKGGGAALCSQKGRWGGGEVEIGKERREGSERGKGGKGEDVGRGEKGEKKGRGEKVEEGDGRGEGGEINKKCFQSAESIFKIVQHNSDLH